VRGRGGSDKEPKECVGKKKARHDSDTKRKTAHATGAGGREVKVGKQGKLAGGKGKQSNKKEEGDGEMQTAGRGKACGADARRPHGI